MACHLLAILGPRLLVNHLFQKLREGQLQTRDSTEDKWVVGGDGYLPREQEQPTGPSRSQKAYTL